MAESLAKEMMSLCELKRSSGWNTDKVTFREQLDFNVWWL